MYGMSVRLPWVLWMKTSVSECSYVPLSPTYTVTLPCVRVKTPDSNVCCECWTPVHTVTVKTPMCAVNIRLTCVTVRTPICAMSILTPNCTVNTQMCASWLLCVLYVRCWTPMYPVTVRLLCVSCKYWAPMHVWCVIVGFVWLRGMSELSPAQWASWFQPALQGSKFLCVFVLIALKSCQFPRQRYRTLTQNWPTILATFCCLPV